MNARLIELIRRRERLLVRAEIQRAEIAGAVHQWRVPVAAFDRVVEFVHTLKKHPALLVLPLAALLVIKPSRLAGWGGKAWMAWRLWRNWRASPLAKWMRHAR
jgi:hypothetical protein